MNEVENINQEIRDYYFDLLKTEHEYWGENSLVEMIDFCARNQLHSIKSALTKLMQPDRIKM